MPEDRYYIIRLRRKSTGSCVSTCFRGGPSHFQNEFRICQKFQALMSAGWTLNIADIDAKFYKILKRREDSLCPND